MASNISLVGKRRAPGVKVNRVQAQVRAVGVSFSDAGMIGISKKGPVDERLVITDYEHFIDRYGDFYNNNYLAPSAKAYFDAGGDTLHVVRIVGSGAAVAGAPLKSHDGLTNAVLVQALDKGNGFLLEVDTLKVEASITTEFDSSSTSVTVDSINGIEQGDLLQVGGTTAGASVAFVQSIDVSTKALTILAPAGMSGTFASGTKCYISTRHRVKTSLSENYTSGSSTMKVSNSSSMFQGQRLYISDGTNHGTAVVKSVNGTTITLAASISTNISSTGSFVVSNEFNADVYEDGVLVDSHEYLSLEDTSSAPNNIEHIEIKLSGDNNESTRIQMTDQDAQDTFTAPSHMTGFESIMAIPVTFSRVALTGGSDGATPTASEWTGVSTQGSETGLYLFNGTKDVRFLAMPGQTDVTAVRNAIDYCENNDTKGNCNYIVDPPLASKEVEQILGYRNVTLQRNTPFAVLVYPWIHIEHPNVSSSFLTMPPSPFYMGLASRVASTVGIRQPPAGIDDGRLPASVRGLTKVITEPQHALLEEVGIIPVRHLPRYGYVFLGAKTLTRTYNGFEWVPAQFMYNFIAASLEEIGQQYVLKPNNDDTRDRLSATVENFMKSLFANGEFVPEDNAAEAYFVKCDEENNTTDIQDSGNLVCDVGYRTPTPAAFINFRLGRSNGRVTVTQSSV